MNPKCTESSSTYRTCGICNPPMVDWSQCSSVFVFYIVRQESVGFETLSLRWLSVMFWCDSA